MHEVNFDGLVGPTHNYGGLAYGNIASFKHKNLCSNPKEAALQGLEKMYALHCLGVKQGVFPPHERPLIPFLRQLGFSGTEEQILKETPAPLLAAASSAAGMWAANAATASPSEDSGTLHFTPANLCSHLHRAIETKTTQLILKKIFPFAAHCDPLPSTPRFSDEGAANHTRFSNGVHLFVYGTNPKKYPARQSLEASQAIARLHKLNADQTVFAEQNSEAIDAGVFHNDVIAVGFENLFFFHERAFLHTGQTVAALKSKIPNLICLRVNEHEIALERAVSTYLFNSQIVKDNRQRLLLIAPTECQEDSQVAAFLKNTPFDEILYFNLKQSMQNGGGPACLRLRVPLTDEELKQVHPGVLMTPELYEALKKWIKAHYRDRLMPEDLRDRALLNESRLALDQLTKLLKLGVLYDFQRG
jgi:succinylarginine dihydrolase